MDEETIKNNTQELFEAIKRNDVELVEKILQRSNLNLTYQDGEGNNILHIIIKQIKGCLEFSTDMRDLILKSQTEILELILPFEVILPLESLCAKELYLEDQNGKEKDLKSPTFMIAKKDRKVNRNEIIKNLHLISEIEEHLRQTKKNLLTPEENLNLTKEDQNEKREGLLLMMQRLACLAKETESLISKNETLFSKTETLISNHQLIKNETLFYLEGGFLYREKIFLQKNLQNQIPIVSLAKMLSSFPTDRYPEKFIKTFCKSMHSLVNNIFQSMYTRDCDDPILFLLKNHFIMSELINNGLQVKDHEVFQYYFQYMLRKSDTDIIKLLLNNGYDHLEGSDYIFIAIREGNHDIVKLFVECDKCNVNVLNQDGETPLDFLFESLSSYETILSRDVVNERVASHSRENIAKIQELKNYLKEKGAKTAEELKKESEAGTSITEISSTQVRPMKETKKGCNGYHQYAL